MVLRLGYIAAILANLPMIGFIVLIIVVVIIMGNLARALIAANHAQAPFAGNLMRLPVELLPAILADTPMLRLGVLVMIIIQIMIDIAFALLTALRAQPRLTR